MTINSKLMTGTKRLKVKMEIRKKLWNPAIV